jgi:hypothetical protein
LIRNDKFNHLINILTVPLKCVTKQHLEYFN